MLKMCIHAVNYCPVCYVTVFFSYYAYFFRHYITFNDLAISYDISASFKDEKYKNKQEMHK